MHDFKINIICEKSGKWRNPTLIKAMYQNKIIKTINL